MESREVRVSLTTERGFLPAMIGADEHGTKGSPSEVINLSRSGMFVKTSATVAQGDTVHFSIDSGRPNASRVSGIGTVRWSRSKDEGPYSPRGIGLKVIQFHAESQNVWLNIIEGCLADLKITDLMTPDVTTCAADASVREVVESMAARRETVAMVVNSHHGPIGVLSETELLLHQLRPGLHVLPVGAVMERKIRTMTTHDRAEDVFEAFKGLGVNHIPITEKDRVVGVVSAVGVMPLMAELMDLKARRLKRNFDRAMNLIVHDLRNPIGIIKTSHDLVTQGITTAEEYFSGGIAEIVDDNCALMLRLIDELLAVSSGEFDVANLRLENMSLVAAVRRAYMQFRPQAEAKQLHLGLEDPTDDVRIMGDPQRFDQILQNIVSNAIKYSRPGDQIAIRLTTTALMACVIVSDTGQGIVAAELPYIFDEYCKISSQPTRGESSTGLGLSIAKKLVEAHGGKISAMSQLGKGTTFVVELPLTLLA